MNRKHLAFWHQWLAALVFANIVTCDRGWPLDPLEDTANKINLAGGCQTEAERLPGHLMEVKEKHV